MVGVVALFTFTNVHEGVDIVLASRNNSRTMSTHEGSDGKLNKIISAVAICATIA